MKKAILLLFLMLALLFGNRTTSSAQTATIPLGSGTIGDPYLIASLENLYWIANQANNKSNNFSGKYFIQTADIDASSTSTWFSGAGWTPISGTSTDFFGSYNGQGHIISGLHINRSSTGCVGLFGTLGKGTIQNLGLTNVSITGHANVGGLIGYLWNTATVSNCYTTGSVTATDQCCGGLIGKDDGAGGTDNNTVSQCYSGCTVSGTDYTGGLIGQAFSATTTFGTITDCYATGAVTTSDVNTGGLIGWIGAIGSVSNCYATGAVTSSGASATGGLIGSSESKSGTVNNCYATGNVTATLITSFEVGGLIGVASSTGTVSNCYATGTVTAGTTFVNGSLDFSSSIGGLIGKNSSAVSRCFATGATYGGNYVGGLLGLNSGVVSDCYSTGTITDNGYNGHLGGLIGQNQNTVSKCYSISYFISLSSAHGGLVGDNATGGVINNNCFWNTDINTNGVQYVSGGTSVAVGKTTAEMQIQSTFTGWDFTTIWARTDTKNNKYPYLAWQTGYLPTLATTVGSATSTTSINLGGNITNNGNATVTERGIVYSSSNAKPIIGGTGVTKTIIGSGSGSFSTTVGSLIGGTTYYVKSYAINSMGTSYGDEVSFSTTYHITYNLNGGTNNVANTATYTYGVGLTLINPTQTGYTFGGWYDNTGFTGTAITAISTTATGDVTLYAKWTANSYNITYNLNGGTNDAANTAAYTYGVGLTLSNPTQTGYTFGGWYADASFTGTAITTISTAATGDVTLYAKWTVNTYNITYTLNGGTNDAANTATYTYGVGLTLSNPTPQPGYTFGGWYDNASFTGTAVTTISTSATSDKTLYAKWTANSYNITYTLNGGTNNAANTATYTYGVGLTLINPTQTGYTFGGWYDNTGFTGTAITAISTSATSDKTLYAKWTANSYNITYTLNGGTNNAANTATYTYGVGLTLINPTQTGYTFGGWYDNTGFTGTAITAISTTATGDVTLYAKWTANSYNITYNLNGGTNDAANTAAYTYGVGLTLSNPTQTGYTFGGWYADASFTGMAITTISTAATGDVTLYAKWTANSYTITFDAQSGTGGTASVTATYATAMPTATAPTRSGYTFKGYYSAIGGAGTQYYDASMSSVANWDVASDATLYAKWTAIGTYTISYNLYGGTNDVANAATYTYGTGLTLSNPTQTGYTFGGWYDNASFTGTAVTAISASATGDITLYAKWTAIGTYTISYNLYGGTNNVANAATYTYGVGLTLSNPTQTGYTFGGWYDNTGFTGTAITAISTTATGDVTLYAKWTVNSYNITYNLYGGTNDAANAATYTYGVGLTLSNPTRTGYTFGGWYDNTGFTGTAITAISTASSGDVTLYAKWTANSYTISYNLNGGTNDAANTATYTYGIGLTLSNPTRTGYVFGGWYDNASFTGTAVTAISASATGDVTLYAKWTANSYNITYNLNGGTNDAANVATYTYGVGLTLSNPTRTGYTFGGWYDNTSFTGTAVTVISTTASGDVTLYAKWTAHSYNITYYLDGGANDVANVATYTYGVGLTLSNPTQTGYTFGSWYDNETFTGTAIASISTTATDDVTLYAKWTANSYTVTFDAQSGTGGTASVTATYGLAMLTATAPMRSGYTFEGYYSATGGTGTQYYDASMSSVTNWNVTSNATLYAKWTVIGTYTISYNLYGGTNDVANAATYTYGTGLTLSNPTQTGYTFGGWYDNASFTGTAVTAISASATGDVTLYAKWTANAYTVTYNLNGGTNDAANAATYTYGVGLTLDAPTKTGYTFGGWYDNTGFTGTAITAISTSATGDVTLYAKWTAIGTYTISYNLNGGTNNAANTAAYTYGVGLTLSNPTRTGYTFGGWYDNASFTGTAVTAISASATGDVTLYAKWTANSYTISYNLNGGTNDAANTATYTYDIGLTLSNPTRTGYTFGGWYGNASFTGTAVTAISASATGDVTLYAKWTANSYNITYNLNGGTNDAANAATYTYGVGLTLSNLTRTGYTFGGWYDNATFTGTAITSISTTATDDVTLFAKWMANSYTISYNLNGGTNDAANTATYTYGIGLTLSNPTQTGYTFGGWYDNETFTGTTLTIISTIDTGDKTLFAKWTAIGTYTIIASVGSGGSISPAGSISISEGNTQTFTITPNSGYHITDVSVDGSSVGAVSSYTFSNITAHHTIAVSFDLSVVIYPNPCSNGFMVNVGNNTPNLFIYNLMGKLLLSQTISSNSYVNISNLKAGMYVVKVNGKKFELIKKE